MGNTKSQPQESDWRTEEIVSLKEIIRSQDTIIQQQNHDKASAEDDRLLQNRLAETQSSIIQQLRQEIEALQEARQTQTSTQETQTDQDDVYHLGVMPYQTPIFGDRGEYQHHVLDRWLNVDIQRSSHAASSGQPNTSAVRVLNASKVMWSNFVGSAQPPSVTYLGVGDKLYFHGSNEYNVKCILEHGIDVTKSTRATDFSCGRGFYVTKNFGKAVEWSRRVAGWKGGSPAVVAFKINRSLRKEEPHLSLKVNTTTNRKWWECVVSYFRLSGPSIEVRTVLRDVKFIKGPVANNKSLTYGEIPRPYYFTQLCICDQKYAQRFGSLENISFVIFAVNN